MKVENMRGVGEVLPNAAQDEPTVDVHGESVATGIDGVVLRRLRWHTDHRGGLAQVADLTDPFWREPIVYSYCVTIRPGRIKGWGMHRLQDDRYFVAAGRIRVVLHDGRVDSPTFGHFQQIHFTEQTTGLLRIPAGVWHADQNYGETDALIVNFPTRPYNHEDPDKYRIDPHSGEIPFDWTIRDG